MSASREPARGGRSYPVEQPCLLLPFLLDRVKGKSRNNVKAMLARGQVLTDGRRVTRFDHPLTPGQTVTVLDRAAPPLPFEVLYEDGELIAIDKPAGLLSIATDSEKEATAYHILTDYVRAGQPGARIHVVHRLDRDTSGVLLFAKDRALKLAFQDDWNGLVRERGYLAVAEGAPREKSGTIRSWLRETAGHLVYSGPPGGGQEAVTHYTLLAQNGAFSLLRVNIDTGRKNQIRAHLRQLGHPVAGDKKYGASANPLGRLGLHADRLALAHPRTGAELVFTAPSPPQFKRLFPSFEG